MSLSLSGDVRQALNERAKREGHRYPLAFAASLLERAILSPASAAPSPEPETVVMLREVARAFGASLEVGSEGMTLIMPVGMAAGAVTWFGSMLSKCPVLVGVKLTVLPGLGA